MDNLNKENSISFWYAQKLYSIKPTANLITSLALLSTHYRMIPTTYCLPFVKSKWGNYSDL